MKRPETSIQIGRAILIGVLAFAVNVRAQNVFPTGFVSRERTTFVNSSRTAFRTGAVLSGIDRTAEAEWIRGYRDGYEFGLWAGVQDARAVFPPATRPPGYNTHTKHTPYRAGYFAGYSSGYEWAFWHGWRQHAI